MADRQFFFLLVLFQRFAVERTKMQQRLEARCLTRHLLSYTNGKREVHTLRQVKKKEYGQSLTHKYKTNHLFETEAFWQGNRSQVKRKKSEIKKHYSIKENDVYFQTT